ncbi:MAG TPA: ATP-binding protein [Chloroflexota bacterium]
MARAAFVSWWRGHRRAGGERLGDSLSRPAERPSRAAILGAIALAVVPLLLVAGLSALQSETWDEARLVLGLIATAVLCTGGLGWWLGGRLTAAHARELHARVGAEAAAERTGRLQAVTAALSATLTRDEVADVILSHGIAAVEARAGWIVQMADDGHLLRVLHSVGLPDGILERWTTFSADDPTAVSDAALTGQMIVLASPAEALARYPNTADAIRLTGNAAWVAAPLRVDGRTVGALGLSFAAARRFSQADRELIETIARQCTQALERARLYEAEMAAHLAAEQAQRRLAFLASASRLLASSLDYERTLQQVAQLAVPDLADWCIVDLVQGDGSVRRIAVVHADPARAELALELQRRYPRLAPRARHTLRRVLETGQSWLDPQIAEERLIAEARDSEHLALLRGLGFSGEIIVPLAGRDRVLGTITLVAATPSRRYDAEHLALAEDLAGRCALAIENATLYQQARNAVQTRDEFLSIASHELRTPMTSVRGHAQLLRRTLERAPLDPERIRQQADAIVRGSDRLTALIQDLLDVSRIRTGRLDLRLDRFDLAGFVRELVGRQQEQVEPSHRFRLDLPDGPCPVVADADRVEQVLTNLLDNAVKYSPNGGEIVVAVRPEAALARISVSDHGIGVPPEALERVFEPFGRAPNAEASQVPGMGLGLFICRSIVERHGGRMWAESPGEGQGTTLVVELSLEACVEPEPSPVGI